MQDWESINERDVGPTSLWELADKIRPGNPFRSQAWKSSTQKN